MDGGGDGSGRLVLGGGIIVLARLIGWYAARASRLDIRRQTEKGGPLDHRDDHYAPSVGSTGGGGVVSPVNISSR